jgi:hypothetical protein
MAGLSDRLNSESGGHFLSGCRLGGKFMKQAECRSRYGSGGMTFPKSSASLNNKKDSVRERACFPDLSHFQKYKDQHISPILFSISNNCFSVGQRGLILVEKSMGEPDSTDRQLSQMRTELISAARRTSLMDEETIQESLPMQTASGRKVVQISTMVHPEKDWAFIALCDDGSLWLYHGSWSRIENIPQTTYL